MLKRRISSIQLQDNRNSDWYVEILLSSIFLKLPEQLFSDILQNGVLKHFAKSTGKYLCRSFFDKVVGFLPANLLKNVLHHSYFPMNFAILSRAALL